MEIERKFLVKELPDLSGITPVHFERYYLSVSGGVEERVQKTNDSYTIEKKVAVDELTRSTERKEISKEEFEEMKSRASKSILRDSYLIAPGLSIKIYHGAYEGLIRAEVEFSSIDEANEYTPEPWMGKEISHSPLGRDSRLLTLDASSFEKLLA